MIAGVVQFIASLLATKFSRKHGKKFLSRVYLQVQQLTLSKIQIYYISLLCLTGSGTISIHAERFQTSDAPRKQNADSI